MKKLTLNRETLKGLDADQSERIQAGMQMTAYTCEDTFCGCRSDLSICPGTWCSC